MREMKDSGIDWIGEIPCNWAVSKIKYLFDVISGSTPSSAQENWDGDITWITPADYNTKDKYVNEGKRNLSKMGYFSCSTYLDPVGTIVFSKRAPIGLVAIASKELCTNQGCLSCIKKREVSAEYYYYVLSIGTEHFELLGSGTTFKEISANNFLNCQIPFPSFKDQKRIVAFLKNKCTQIDELFRGVQRQIDILEQYEHSVITEVVTRGFDPNVMMKDSGIDWIGEIPNNTKISRIKYEVVPLNRVVLSSDNVVTCFRDGEVTLRNNRRIDGYTISFTEHGYQGVEPGDLVIHGMDAFAGAIGCSDSRGKCTPVVHVCKTTGNNRYFMYYLRSMAYNNVFMDFANGIRVRSSDFRNFARLGEFPVIVPTLSEQNRIVSYLDKRCKKIEKLIFNKQEQLNNLEHYKESLIYEYITGKKEI